MAVEARLRAHDELHSSHAVQGFSLKDVAIKQTLVIPEDDYGVEVMTSLELIDSSTIATATYATFSISSVGRETGEWIEHSTGRIKIEVNNTDDNKHNVTVPRACHPLDLKLWYRKFSDVGLAYGPTFQALSDAHASLGSNVALATVNLNPDDSKTHGSRYAVHPASLDGAIQLGLIACNGGRISEAHTAFVPVQITSLYISANIDQDSCTVMAHGAKRGLRGADLNLQMLGPNGELLLRAENLRCISYSLDNKPVDLTFNSPFTRLVWKPDIRRMTRAQARQLYRPPEENIAKETQWRVTNRVAHFVVLSMYTRMQKLEGVPKLSGDVGHFFEWVERVARNDRSKLMEEARNFARRGSLAESLDILISQAPDIMEVKIAKLLHDNIEDILYERRTGMEVIIEEGLLTPLYQSGLLMTGIYPQLSRIVSGIAHSTPHLRVLEIGGGTGGATRVALKAFTHSNGIKLYKDYTFTDISAGFLSKARESFSTAELQDMSFSVLDVEIDPMEQGYEQVYDLVLACQVLHATSNMHKTLSYCRKLLRPGGRLVMVETTQNFIVPGVVVGTFTGYWAGIPDGRIDAPFQSLSAWQDSLKRAGFSGLDIVLDDFPEPNNTTSVIISTALPEQIVTLKDTRVFVYYKSSSSSSLIECICRELRTRHVNVQQVFSADELGPGSRVIALYNDDNIMMATDKGELESLQHITNTAASLVVLTSCGAVRGRGAGSAVVSGLLRVLQNENPANQYTSIDVDADNFSLEITETQELARAVVDIESRLHEDKNSKDEESSPRDREFSWQNGCLWVSRYVPDTGFYSKYGLDVRRTKPEQSSLGSQGDLRAAFEVPGVTKSLYFIPSNDLLRPLPQDHIDVKVQAWALNAKDFDNWTSRSDGDYLSSEYSGIVTAVGNAVGNLQVGDCVYGLGKGQFGTFARVPAALAGKLETSDRLTQMASLPLAYMTAIYALDYVAHLQKGQSVLVQAGASEFAVAIIKLARAKGADVFAMTDTPEQASFLTHELAMPITNIIAAVNLKHLSKVMESTRNQRFEIYISTSPERDTIHELLAPLGRVIELGSKGNLAGLSGSTRMLTYSSVDVMTILETEPSLAAELIRSVNHYRQQGLAVPIPGLLAIDIEKFSSAPIDPGNFPGKLVVDFGDSQSLVRQLPTPPTAVFDSEASYLITGGLGGLGQTIVRWMVDRGARYFTLLSRRQASSVPEANDFLSSLVSCGIKIECLVCDVSKKKEVVNTVQQISAVRIIKGIVHAAVSYVDLSFDRVSAPRWQAGLCAKVQGTQNLHEATLSMPLDFFIMTTSALSLYAFATQGAYTASNNFQDAFARYRRNLGLPASTISFGLIQEITNVGTDEITVNLFERNNGMTLDRNQFLALLEPAFLNNRTTTQQTAVPWTGKFEDPLSSANLHTYLNPQALIARQQQAAESNTLTSMLDPTWYSDARVSHMMRAFRDLQRKSDPSQSSEVGSQNSVSQLRAAFSAAVRDGSNVRGPTVALVQDSIVSAVATMLYVDVEDIDAAKSVAGLGVDSLIAAELRNWFLRALDANISMLDLLDPAVSINARASTIVDQALEAVKV